MSAVPAARFLAEFGAAPVTAAPPEVAEPDADHGARSAAEMEEAFARGVEEGRAAAQAECDAKLEEQRGEFVAELEAARQEWASGAGEQLASSLQAAVGELEARIVETAARILKPFLSARLHAQAVAELQTSLEVLVSADPEVAFRICGPGDVLDAIRERLEGKAVSVTYEPNDECDVRIVAGPTTVETRLEDWMARLEEAVP